MPHPIQPPGEILKILKILMVFGIVLLLLPSSLWNDGSGPMGDFDVDKVPGLENTSIQDLASSGIQCFTNLYKNQPVVCEVWDAALDRLHVFAVDTTGSLRMWFKEGLDEKDRA
jgi:hypothetical protein